MKRLLALLALVCFVQLSIAQSTIFESEIVIEDYEATEILMPPSELTTQVLFVGGHDIVQTTPTYGNPAGRAIAKEWHDFIGFTPDADSDDLGWVSVNHEQIYQDDRIGDGGGMTVFKVKRAEDGLLEVVEQTLSDGRQGHFFNVDFVNTVGETGMNCAGISSIVDGRIWTAEEWFRSSTSSIYNGVFRTGDTGWAPHNPAPSAAGYGVRDTSDYTITSDIAEFNGITVPKYENFNYMVEIDPREAVAMRKQYNWGRAGWEGGAVSPDNLSVYLGIDATPAPWVRYVTETPGDFLNGTLQVWKHDNAEGERWIDVPLSVENMKDGLLDFSWSVGATMYNRNEWVAVDPLTGIVYWTETGRDNPGGSWADEADAGGVYAPHHVARAMEQGVESPGDEAYWDYYGRVLYYDPATETEGVMIEGGPFFDASPAVADYPSKHLSNPDGLSTMEIDGQTFLVIQEDLNGTSFGRMPEGIGNRLCELFLLPTTSFDNSVDDLIRVTAVPAGAEITGAVQTPDGNTLLVNSQHPNVNNPFPYNHSLTFAIHGFNDLTVTSLDEPDFGEEDGMVLFPNPTTRMIYLSESTDFAIYDGLGKRLRVYRNTNEANVADLAKGNYYVKVESGKVFKLLIQ